MLNVDCKVEGDTLVCRINLKNAPLTPSASGKTRIVASTQGNQKITGGPLPGLTVGLNAYVPNVPAQPGK